MLIAKLTGMKWIYAFLAIILITIMPQISLAAVSSEKTHNLKLRTGQHTKFLRIVLEGSETIMSGGTVKQRGKDILVIFAGAGFTIRGRNVTVPYKKDKDLVSFSPGNFSEFKFFFLKKPSRLVIDVYRDTREKVTKPSLNLSEKSPEIHNPETLVKEPEHSTREDDTATEDYKQKIRDILNSDNPFKALKEFSEHETDTKKFLAIYHFVLAEMFNRVEDYLAAIAHYGLIPVYTDNNELKELSLGKKAELYLNLGHAHEARANYLNFIKDFPSSRHIAKAHLGLAKSLEGIGHFKEAIEYYKKADNEPEALFGIANALQKLGRVEEAHKAYDRAILADNTFPVVSPETYYLMGENMRMIGKTADAKRHLLLALNGPFKDKVRISLGLIAMEESKIKDAIKNFRSAAMSKNRNLKGEALFHLSMAFLKADRLNKAVSALEEIRYKHPYTSIYGKALFDLSRLYRKEGRFEESASLLKELVYGQSPPVEVFNELEVILREASKKTEKGAADDEQFVNLWNDIGQWLLDSSREQFLLETAEALRHEGKPFLVLSTWLVENASKEVKTQAARGLAGFYADMEDANAAEKYLSMIRDAKTREDFVLRTEAKIYYASGELKPAVEKIQLIKKFEKDDLALLWNVINVISDSKASGSKDMQEAIDLYKKIVRKLEVDDEEYIRLADILYDNNRSNEAIKYYRGVRKNEWAMYRIGIISKKDEAEEIFSHLQKGDSTLSHMARTKLMEQKISNKAAEVF